LAEAAELDDHRLAARRARLARRLVPGPRGAVDVARVLAPRVAGARQEHAEAAPTPQEFLAALGAGLARGLAGLLAAHLLLRPGEVLLERHVELPHGLDPRAFPLLDLVEVVLHLRRELDVHDLGGLTLELLAARPAGRGRP